jgi:hypothetical protein
MRNLKNKSTKYLSGQAMTETLITAVMILVPLLMMIPLLGKYIDIKHATIQAARYQAWEYTVWYSEDAERTDPLSTAERSTGFVDGNGSSLDNFSKTTEDTQREARNRFFSNPLTGDDPTPITNNDKGDWSVDDRNPLWTDHQGNPLVLDTFGDAPPTPSADTPDLTLGFLTTILDVIRAITGAMAWVMGGLGSDVGFTMINTDGYSTSQVSFPGQSPRGLIAEPTTPLNEAIPLSARPLLNLNFTGQAAVLTDGWNSGGLVHTTNQTGGLVVTSMIDEIFDSIPGWSAIRQTVSALIPEFNECDPPLNMGILDENWGTYSEWNGSDYDNHPEQSITGNGSLWLGYMNADAVHPDRLDFDGDGVTDGSHACPDGICALDPEPVYTDCDPDKNRS